MLRVLKAIFRREMILAVRGMTGTGLGVVFLAVFTTLVSFMRDTTADDGRVSIILLWIGVFLSTLLGIDRMLYDDEETGVLDQVLLATAPLEALLAVKGLAHWLASGLPLCLVSPVFAMMMGVSFEVSPFLALSLIPGTLAMTMFGLIGAAVSLSLSRGGAFLSTLVLPLSIPTLVFGVSLIEAIQDDRIIAAPMKLLIAASLIACVCSPVAAAWVLRMARK